MEGSALTRNDSQVLAQIFDPEAAPSPGIAVDFSLPSDPNIGDEEVFHRIRAAERTIILRVEEVLKSTALPVGHVRQILAEASAELEVLIAQYPQAACLRNDHAQLFRLQHGDDVLISASSQAIPAAIAEETRVAMANLATAIRLCTPPTPQAAVSPAQSRTLGQAHTQRGALYLRAARLMAARAESSVSVHVAVAELEGWGQLEFEEAASRDFLLGGRYGSAIGKALAVHTNPTAKLCGQIVQDAMKREMALGDAAA